MSFNSVATYIVSNLGNYCPVLISFYNVLTPEGISPDIIPNISKSYYVTGYSFIVGFSYGKSKTNKL